MRQLIILNLLIQLEFLIERYNAKGKINDSVAAKPAGLSKLPLIPMLY